MDIIYNMKTNICIKCEWKMLLDNNLEQWNIYLLVECSYHFYSYYYWDRDSCSSTCAKLYVAIWMLWLWYSMYYKMSLFMKQVHSTQQWKYPMYFVVKKEKRWSKEGIFYLKYTSDVSISCLSPVFWVAFVFGVCGG